jgi:cyclopropane fatty-acyl-phospholipid synthase-like methyltransferase
LETIMPSQRFTKQELAQELAVDAFPRSASYDPEWTLENLMGPNVLWLTEALCQVVALEPGMRVLDMGCGRAISSIFLAKEFGVQVWATDLWIGASDNWQRVCAAGLQDRVFPIHAEAHSLPFAEGFFDALVSLDAYHYFGTDDLYLGYYARFVKEGGQLGIVVPGIQHEFTSGVPEHLAPYWERDFWSFHSPAWWREHWQRTGPVEVAVTDMAPNGWQHWLKWLEVAGEYGFPTSAEEAEMLRRDAGRNLGFSRLVGRKA